MNDKAQEVKSNLDLSKPRAGQLILFFLITK